MRQCIAPRSETDPEIHWKEEGKMSLIVLEIDARYNNIDMLETYCCNYVRFGSKKSFCRLYFLEKGFQILK